MSIRSVFKRGLGNSSPTGLYKMSRTVDVAGLVDHIDKVNHDDIYLIFQYLTELCEYGNYDKVIAYGATPRAVEMMKEGPHNLRKAAMSLVCSLVYHGRGDIVMATDGVIGSVMTLLEEGQEKDVESGVSYILSVLCSLGGAEEFIEKGGIRKLAPLVRSDDDNTLLYTLFTLTTISQMGYQEEILETKVNQHISYHMPRNKEIESLSQLLLDDLYDWDEESFSLNEEDMVLIDKHLDLIGVEGGYQRPQITKQRIEPRGGVILGQNGKEFPRNEEKEIIIEIKRRKLASKKQMEEREFQNILDGKEPKKKEKKAPQKKIVRQRVLKRDFEDEIFIKRKIENVISGRLGPPPKPAADPRHEPEVPPDLGEKEQQITPEQVQ